MSILISLALTCFLFVAFIVTLIAAWTAGSWILFTIILIVDLIIMGIILLFALMVIAQIVHGPPDTITSEGPPNGDDPGSFCH